MTSKVLLSIAACASVVTGAAFANEILLGTRTSKSAVGGSLSLAQSGGGAPLFQVSGVTPGWQRSACVLIGPEGADVDGFGLSGATGGSLAGALSLTVTRGVGAAGGATHSCAGFVGVKPIYVGTLAGWSQTGAGLVDTAHVGSGGRVAYRFTIALPTNASVTHAGKTATATFTFGADPVAVQPPSECSDGIDNDGDGRVDGGDGGCTSAGDSSEREDVRQVDDLVLCGRRAISLISATKVGKRVRLHGVVGKAQRSTKVEIYEGKRRIASVTPSAADGQFSASVKAPPRKRYARARYSARTGASRSVALKLPQSLESTSIRLAGATSTLEIRGKVFGPKAKRPQPVIVRRILCGRYETVGQVRPSRNGSYRLRFAAPDAAAGLYRAETRLPARKGSKRLKRAYARAVAISLDERSG